MEYDYLSMVGLRNSHIHKNLTQNVNPRDTAGNAGKDFTARFKACLPPTQPNETSQL